MDNLFAIIIPHNKHNKANGIFNHNLTCTLFDNSSSASIEVPNKNNFIYLAKYSNKTTNISNNSQPTKQILAMPITGHFRVDNKDDLAAICKADLSNKNQFSSKDEHAFFTTYKKLGAACFSKIKGNFQTVFWDEQSQKLCAAIDPFSSRSLFYLELSGVLYLSSDAKTLATITNIKLTVNKVAISQWLAGRPTPNICMFNEISRLPSGHYLEYNEEQGVKITKFWDIDPNFSINYNDTEQYKSHFFELLKTSVESRLSTEHSTTKPTVFCQMSGGMDSTSVTAIAKQFMDGKNQPLHTLSHRYKNTQTCDESTNINNMISTLGLEHQYYIDLDEYESSSFSQLYPTDFDSPGIVLSPKYHQELALMHSLGTNVLLTGNGGDETCWGHSASYRSRLFKGEFGVISEVIKACNELNEPVARSLYKLFMPSSIQNLVKLARQKPINTNECPPWLSPQALMNVSAENQLFTNPFSASFDPAKHARYHGLNTTSTYNAMRSYQKVASDYGIDVRHPFFDADIVKFSFAIPEKLLIQGAYPKWLLRQTMQAYLPASVCWNKHKVVFDHHFANLIRANKVELRKLLSHSGLQDLGLVNNTVLLSEFDAVVNNPDSYLNVDMLYAILTQLWFQTHCI
ncbi:asparagine synthase-related protein [Colwellia sp. TT2012]|uniref:asparagine synthase-related protein n=1 Tax=Colwellia sp. TT2012 TaxID=1720342 RepID=UPI00070BB020|nr:asparagine synthase-related protein [Colwellia sp. TT2012]